MKWFVEPVVALSLLASVLPAASAEKKKPVDEPAEELRIDVPVPPGHEAKELKFPVFDTSGRLQMTFLIKVARRSDETHLNMSKAQVETFNEQGKREMLVELPTSVLDLRTSVLSSNGPVRIQRTEFELTGEGMTFDTRTKVGTLTGNIRMLIYDKETVSKEGGR